MRLAFFRNLNRNLMRPRLVRLDWGSNRGWRLILVFGFIDYFSGMCGRKLEFYFWRKKKQ